MFRMLFKIILCVAAIWHDFKFFFSRVPDCRLGEFCSKAAAAILFRRERRIDVHLASQQMVFYVRCSLGDNLIRNLFAVRVIPLDIGPPPQSFFNLDITSSTFLARAFTPWASMLLTSSAFANTRMSVFKPITGLPFANA